MTLENDAGLVWSHSPNARSICYLARWGTDVFGRFRCLQSWKGFLVVTPLHIPDEKLGLVVAQQQTATPKYTQPKPRRSLTLRHQVLFNGAACHGRNPQRDWIIGEPPLSSGCGWHYIPVATVVAVAVINFPTKGHPMACMRGKRQEYLFLD